MEKASKGAAWICIFSTLLMGCYTTAVVEPTGAAEKMRSGEINLVIMKDSTKYDFQTPPTVVKDTIVGEIRAYGEGGFAAKLVSLPLSNVAFVSVSEYSSEQTTIAIQWIVGTILFAGIVAGVVALTKVPNFESSHH
jgi:hypothetical protein